MSDPFAFLAPADPIARLLVAHQRTDTSACHCGWAALGESHAEHVAELVRSAFHRPRGLDIRPPERAILLDLIAELRKQHKRCCPPRDKRKDHECLGCRENWPCSHTRTLDSAEAQLKQLG